MHLFNVCSIDRSRETERHRFGDKKKTVNVIFRASTRKSLFRTLHPFESEHCAVCSVQCGKKGNKLIFIDSVRLLPSQKKNKTKNGPTLLNRLFTLLHLLYFDAFVDLL